MCYNPGYVVSVPERSKGVDSSSTVFALVGSNPTADTTFCIFLLHNTHNTHAHTPHAHTHTSTTTTTALLTLHPTTLHHPRHTHTRPPDPQRASVTHSHAREFWPLLTTTSNPTPSTHTHTLNPGFVHTPLLPRNASCVLRLASCLLPLASCLLPRPYLMLGLIAGCPSVSSSSCLCVLPLPLSIACDHNCALARLPPWTSPSSTVGCM